VVLGPIKLEDNVKIGAGSVALNDTRANDVVFGVPAVSLFRRKLDVDSAERKLNVNSRTH